MKKSGLKIILIICFGIQFQACEQKVEEPKYVEVFCDAERVTAEGDLLIARDKFGGYFRGGPQQTDEKAYSGKYCVKLSKGSAFGMTYTLDNVHRGEKYEVSVRRFKNNKRGKLVVSAGNAELFYLAQTIVEKKDSIEDWELLKLEFEIPLSAEGENLKVYVWNPDELTPAFFDDLCIKYFMPQVPEQ